MRIPVLIQVNLLMFHGFFLKDCKKIRIMWDYCPGPKSVTPHNSAPEVTKPLVSMCKSENRTTLIDCTGQTCLCFP